MAASLQEQFRPFTKRSTQFSSVIFFTATSDDVEHCYVATPVFTTAGGFYIAVGDGSDFADSIRLSRPLSAIVMVGGQEYLATVRCTVMGRVSDAINNQTSSNLSQSALLALQKRFPFSNDALLLVAVEVKECHAQTRMVTKPMVLCT